MKNKRLLDREDGRTLRGCLIAAGVGLAILLLASLLLALGTRMAARSLAKKWTSETPTEVSMVQVSKAEEQALEQRVHAFRQALDKDQEARLSLSEKDINGAIASSKEIKDMGAQVSIQMEGDQTYAVGSFPVSVIPVLKDLAPKNSFLNAKIKLLVGIEAGALVVRADEVLVDGTPLPSSLVNALRQQNLAESFADDSEARKVIQKLKKIEVKEGRLILEK